MSKRLYKSIICNTSLAKRSPNKLRCFTWSDSWRCNRRCVNAVGFGTFTCISIKVLHVVQFRGLRRGRAIPPWLSVSRSKWKTKLKSTMVSQWNLYPQTCQNLLKSFVSSGCFGRLFELVPSLEEGMSLFLSPLWEVLVGKCSSSSNQSSMAGARFYSNVYIRKIHADMF